MKARPKLNDWLDALNEMPQLNRLSLRSATPVAPVAGPLISRTVSLPSLTRFHIGASAKDCALALAHLVLPNLTLLHINVKSLDWEGEDVLQVIPHVVQNVCVLHDIEPIRGILIAGEETCAEILTWTTPGADVKVRGPDSLEDMSCSARFLFAAKGVRWNYGVDTTIFDALLTHLPMSSVSTFTAQNYTRLSQEFWLRHAPRLPLLEQAGLVPNAVSAFMEMLSEDIPLDSDGPRLPMLTKLILFEIRLTRISALYLRDILIERVEQGVPLEHLDLRTCEASNREIKLLAEIVVDVQEPLDAPTTIGVDYFNLQGRIGRIEYGNRVEFDNKWGPWYGGRHNTDDSDEDEDEDDSEDEDEDEDDDDSEDEGDGDGDESDEVGDEGEIDSEMGN